MSLTFRNVCKQYYVRQSENCMCWITRKEKSWQITKLLYTKSLYVRTAIDTIICHCMYININVPWEKETSDDSWSSLCDGVLITVYITNPRDLWYLIIITHVCPRAWQEITENVNSPASLLYSPILTPFQTFVYTRMCATARTVHSCYSLPITRFKHVYTYM